MAETILPEGKRKSLERAACLIQGLRDLLLPEIAATVAPLGAILTPAADDLDFACPLPPDSKLDRDLTQRVDQATVLVRACCPSAKPTPSTTRPWS